MAVRPTDDHSVANASPPSTPHAVPNWLYYVATGLAGVIVVCVLTLVFLFVHDTGDGSVGDRVSSLVGGDSDAESQGDPAASASERDAAMSVADQFMLRVNTYGPHDLDKSNQMPGYVSRVHEVSTSKLQASFDQGVTLAEQSVSQTGVARSADLFATGVSTIDADSADVLVAGRINQTYPDPKAPTNSSKRIRTEPVPFRFDVKLVKIDGKWLADDFTPVTGQDGSGSSGTPSTGPSSRPSSRPSSSPSKGTKR